MPGALRADEGDRLANEGINVGAPVPVFGVAAQEAETLQLAALEVAVEERLQVGKRQPPLLVHLGADHLQRVGQVGQPHEGALHPVVGGAAVVDVAAAGDAIGVGSRRLPPWAWRYRRSSFCWQPAAMWPARRCW